MFSFWKVQVFLKQPKVSFSMVRRQYIRECFKEIFEVASQPGVHYKMAAIMEYIFTKVKKVDRDIRKHK